jgi:hypothetical protein
MADAHLIDPTRFISYGSGFMTPGATQPTKLHMLPYDQTQRTVGFVDIHNAGNSPGVYTDAIYNSPQNFYRNEHSPGEIFVWGEEGALASPPQLEMIQENIAQTGYNGWDGADYKDWYNTYVNYFQKKKLTTYYPSITGLITSLGNIQYYEHGRMIENARIADGADLYVLNEHAIPAGTYLLKAKVSKPDGAQQEIFSDGAQVSGGEYPHYRRRCRHRIDFAILSGKSIQHPGRYAHIDRKNRF